MHRFLPLFPASRGDFNALGAWWQTVYNIICTFIFRLDVSHLPLSPRSESRHLSLTAPSLPPTPLSLIQYPKQAEGEEERNPRPSNPMGETDRQHLLRPSSSSSSLCASDPQRAKAHPCIHALTYTHKQRDRPTPDRPGLLAHMLSPLSLLPSLFLSHKTGLRREGEGEGGRQQTPPFDWSRGTQHRWIQKREREKRLIMPGVIIATQKRASHAIISLLLSLHACHTWIMEVPGLMKCLTSLQRVLTE